MRAILNLITLLLLNYSSFCFAKNTAEVANESDDHKFGDTGPSIPIHELTGFPEPVHFFEAFVFRSIPVKFKQALKNSFAFTKWTDEYFLALDMPDDKYILVETKKKEDRSGEPIFLHFQEFVKMYNNSDYYMVDQVPQPLQKDILLPQPLHCTQIMEEYLIENVMWYSSGGTKSVIHTDSAENILCLIRGTKDVVMVDPHIYGHHVNLDHPEGGYSSLDVDRVSLEEHPGLAEVTYQRTTLHPGDCLYIPYKWIHQVRSFGSNLAVNTWWNHHQSFHLDMRTCQNIKQTDLTFDKLQFWGFDRAIIDSIREELLLLVTHDGMISLDTFCQFFSVLDDGDCMPDLQNIFLDIDRDSDGHINRTEILDTKPEDWQHFSDILVDYEKDSPDSDNFQHEEL